MRVLVRCTLAFLVPALLAGPVLANMTTELAGSGFSSPVFLAAPEGDTERLFVVEQAGLIKIIKNGQTLATPFLDWRSNVQDGSNEQGLLGLAFDPDFDTNGFFYIYFTAGSQFSSRSVIRRFTVSSGNPDVADTGTVHRVFRFEQTDTNHNGGHIEFGPDGYMYVGLGDGGGADDPFNAGQNGQTLLAKMLRIDVDGDDFPADSQQNYAIPPDNPFVGNAGIRDEIWSLGMRNPYRWAFDEANGDLYIGDVGQNCWEEIDFESGSSPGGLNFGWSVTEGSHCFTNPFNCNQAPCGSGITLPIWEYSHNLDGFSCSVTGGRVYRGQAIATMQGHYFYADYCSDQIYTFRYDGATVTERTNRTAELDPPNGVITEITAFGKDGENELYIVERGGQIWKIVSDPKTGVDPGASVARPRIELSPLNPNPFRSIAFASLRVDEGADATVRVYTATGRLVAGLHDGPVGEDTLQVSWDGRDAQGDAVAAGVYFVRAESRGEVSSRSVTVLR